MPIDIRWYNDEKSLLIYDFQGEWTITEFHAAVDKVAEMLKGYQGRLDIISDLSHAKNPRDASSGAMQAAWNRSYKVLPEDYHLAVVVGAGLLLEFFLKTFGKIYAPIRNHVRAAKTFDEALQLIMKDRAESLNKSA